MSEAIQILPSLRPFNQTNPTSHNTLPFSHQLSIKTAFSLRINVRNGIVKALKSPSSEGLDSPPLSLEMERVSSETEFDLILDKAKKIEEPIIVVWMASWCRKCIYLKPKLEKLAAQYYPRVRFYCVDVNGVSHKFVVRAEVTKMPTIQLWKDSKKQAEVIGGHKAYLVVNEVRDMIENESAITIIDPKKQPNHRRILQ